MDRSELRTELGTELVRMQKEEDKTPKFFISSLLGPMQGDCAGICVTQFDPKLLERGLVCSAGALPTIYAGLVSVSKIRYFKGSITTSAKYHITMGHETVMAHVSFFGYTTDLDEKPSPLDLSRDFVYQEELLEDILKDDESNTPSKRRVQFALLEFDKSVTCCESCLVIGSKLDSDINANVCRISFNGVLLKSYVSRDGPGGGENLQDQISRGPSRKG